MRKKISLLVPCFNEQDTLRNLHICVKNVADQHTEYDWEFLFVNDGSKDNTLTILRELREVDERVCYVDLSRNFGKENAMLAGFDYVTGDCAIVLDADLQDPPSLIPEMISWWEKGYQDVYARRKSRGEESWLRRKMSLAYYSLLQKTTRIDILENVGDFRLLGNQRDTLKACFAGLDIKRRR